MALNLFKKSEKSPSTRGRYFFLRCFIVLSTISVDATTGHKITKDLKILNVHNLSSYEQLLQCDYFKYQATTFCKSNYSDIDERMNCSKSFKERWCECMGEQKDCYKQQSFYW